jgi:dipeptidase D
MNPSLTNLDYKNIFHYFSEISAVPRGSANNTAISNYLVDYAKKHGLDYMQDEYENVIIMKEASKGYENSPAVIIQGHMDMVCEKTNESNHDFLTQGIDLIVENDFIHADGTTLGADDGIALAYALALLEDDTIGHPRIEAVFTTDEETGMEGAIGLEVSKLKGKYLLNVDSEEEGIILTSAAGGLRGESEIPVKRVSGTGLSYRITISNLQGGHSGTEINKNRVNATRLMGRLLFELRDSVNFGLINMTCGNKDNAIPRDSAAEIFLFAEDLEDFKNEFEHLVKTYKAEYNASEPDLLIQANEAEKGEFHYLHPTSFQKVYFYL